MKTPPPAAPVLSDPKVTDRELLSQCHAPYLRFGKLCTHIAFLYTYECVYIYIYTFFIHTYVVITYMYICSGEIFTE